MVTDLEVTFMTFLIIPSVKGYLKAVFRDACAQEACVQVSQPYSIMETKRDSQGLYFGKLMYLLVNNCYLSIGAAAREILKLDRGLPPMNIKMCWSWSVSIIIF
ncbi:hypothetical protein DPMN_110465 [Dreissena polymorpha]|uniref:Uncharacterized protein n=1 Tax=Dreissena polymorpha TaxID=45954 RepID=A0A9D4KD18_DREPO|nr:hypothetical protein DPMN_110465 [Dreissena polymorpha]